MQTDTYTDVVELCTILQCLGFTVKSLDTSGDVSLTQDDGGSRTVVVNCHTSGLRVVLESLSMTCTCPPTNEQNSGFWQVSGVAGGKQQSKETGSNILGSLPKAYRDHLSKELKAMVRSIQGYNESDVGRPINRSTSGLDLGNKSSLLEVVKEGMNKSASMVELSTPEKQLQNLKADTPTRYRSLDTLTSAKGDPASIRLLQRLVERDGKLKDNYNALAHRQSTYTVYSTPGSVRTRNKTSSPIHAETNIMNSLIAAEKTAEELRNRLSHLIREFADEAKDSSMSSLALDVSKISLMKGPEPSTSQFASSPNLSGLTAREDSAKSRLLRKESASTSNLASKSITDRTSNLRRLSPSLFKPKKETDKGVDGKSRLQNLFKAKIATPVRIPKSNSDLSPSMNLSGSKKKYSHIKSTIPRPMPIKKE